MHLKTLLGILVSVLVLVVASLVWFWKFYSVFTVGRLVPRLARTLILSLFINRASVGLVRRLRTRSQILAGLGPAGMFGWSFCIRIK